MYCKKCGCRLALGNNVCGHCGEPASSSEYCGGFWGLIDKDEAVSGGDPVSIRKNHDPEYADSMVYSGIYKDMDPGSGTKKQHGGKKTSHKKGNFRYMASLVIGGILLVMLIAQTVHVAVVKSRLSKQEDSYIEQEDSYNSLKEEYTSVKEENKKLKIEKLSLKDDISKLEDQINKFIKRKQNKRDSSMDNKFDEKTENDSDNTSYKNDGDKSDAQMDGFGNYQSENDDKEEDKDEINR